MQSSLHQLFFIDDHIVTQIIKSELIVRHIRDVTVICFPAFFIIHAIEHNAHRKSKEFMDLSHPLGITFRQIVVYCNDIDAFSFQRIQICRECGYKRLTFTCLHLGDTALMKYDTSDKLHPVMTHPEYPERRLPHDCICFRKNIVQSLTLAQTLLEFPCLSFEFLIRKCFHLRLHGLDPVNERIDPLQFVLAVGAENLLYNTHITQLTPYK